MRVIAIIIVISGGNNSIQITTRFWSALSPYRLLEGIYKGQEEILCLEGDNVGNHIQSLNLPSPNGKNFHGVP